MKKAQSQNLAVEAANTTPPPVPGIDMERVKADMDQCRLIEFAAFVQANQGKRIVSVPLTFDEFEAMSIAAGRHNGGDVAAYLKESASASCESDTNALAHELRNGTAKIVTTKGAQK